jgi:hypothetical protein
LREGKKSKKRKAMQSQICGENFGLFGTPLRTHPALPTNSTSNPLHQTPSKFRRVTNTQVAMAATMSLSTSHNTTPPPQFTPLEQELLAEYQKLVTNMNTVLPPSTWVFGTRR